jgi:hypothetical protein
VRVQKWIGVAVGMLLATSASAGQLLSATYTQTIQGVDVVLTTTTATGSLVGNQFSLDAGSWFATRFCIANFGATACPQAQTPMAPIAPTVVKNVTSMFGTAMNGLFKLPVQGINLTFGGNGAVTGTTSQNTIAPAAGITGIARVMAKIGIVFTLVPVPINAGVANSPMLGGATLMVSVFGDEWHLAPVAQSALTSNFVAIPDVAANGSVSVTGGGNTVVNLVSLGRLKLRGLANSETSSPTFLRLVYAPSVPEPGTLALLGAGVAGLVMIGRRKLR